MSKRTIAIIVGILIAASIGIYTNAKRAHEVRGNTIAVMVPSLEPKDTWQNLVTQLNDSPTVEKSVELYYVPHGPGGTSYEQKYIVMSAAREAPEIILLLTERFDLYAEQELLVALNDVADDLTRQGVSFDADALNKYTVDGDILGLPHPNGEFALSVSVLSVNPEEGKQALRHLYPPLLSTSEHAPPVDHESAGSRPY